MANTLVFPDGIRLAQQDEIPGSEREREESWQRIASARIEPGYVVRESTDSRFACYAEANVDAPSIWTVFRDLCRELLGPNSVLLMGEIDEDPTGMGPARTSTILTLLEEHAYQLANDGRVQFGLLDDRSDSITEVFVAPTKYLEVWSNSESRLRATLARHGLPESDRLEFIDEYPRTTIRLPDDRVAFCDHSQLIAHFRELIAGLE